MPHHRRATKTVSALAFLALAVAVPAALLVFGSAGCMDQKVVQPSSPAADAESAGHRHGHGHDGHDTGSTTSKLILSTDPAEVVPGEPVRLRAMVHRADGSMVSEFEEIHEEFVHLIVVREGLDHFAHLHPEVDDAGNVMTQFTFPAGGRYLLYADHKPAGEPQAVARGDLRVDGETPDAPELTPDVPGRVSGDGLTANVAVEDARPGGEARITFDLLDLAGRPVTDLETYLGALGHLVVLSEDGGEYVHAHPLESRDATDGRVAFAAHFAGQGLYKGWAQFQRSGRVLTVPFVLRVEPAPKS